MSKRTCEQPGCERPHLARGTCRSHYNLLHADPAKRWPKEVRACVVCFARVVRRVDNPHAPTCSVECRTIHQHGNADGDGYDWSVEAMRRARSFGVTLVEPIRREDVFARDGWVCQGCQTRCGQPDPFDLNAATVDHITPLSQGGVHSMSNVRTLCLSCNSARQASPAA